MLEYSLMAWALSMGRNRFSAAWFATLAGVGGSGFTADGCWGLAFAY